MVFGPKWPLKVKQTETFFYLFKFLKINRQTFYITLNFFTLFGCIYTKILAMRLPSCAPPSPSARVTLHSHSLLTAEFPVSGSQTYQNREIWLLNIRHSDFNFANVANRWRGHCGRQSIVWNLRELTRVWVILILPCFGDVILLR